MADHLQATSRKVYLRHDYARKAAEKHGVTAAQFPAIFDTIERGSAYADKLLHITFYHIVDGVLWQVTIKRAFDTRRLYIATFYQQNQKDVARKTAKVWRLRP